MMFMNKTVNVTEIFGMDVFSDAVMRERLPEHVYADIKRTIQTGAEMSKATANEVANAMKDWAVER